MIIIQNPEGSSNLNQFTMTWESKLYILSIYLYVFVFWHFACSKTSWLCISSFIFLCKDCWPCLLQVKPSSSVTVRTTRACRPNCTSGCIKWDGYQLQLFQAVTKPFQIETELWSTNTFVLLSKLYQIASPLAFSKTTTGVQTGIFDPADPVAFWCICKVKQRCRQVHSWVNVELLTRAHAKQLWKIPCIKDKAYAFEAFSQNNVDNTCACKSARDPSPSHPLADKSSICCFCSPQNLRVRTDLHHQMCDGCVAP